MKCVLKLTANVNNAELQTCLRETCFVTENMFSLSQEVSVLNMFQCGPDVNAALFLYGETCFIRDQT